MTPAWRNLTAFGVACLAAAALTGCPEDQQASSTWISKLGDSNNDVVERAVTKLEQIGESKAIPALGKAWEKQGRPEHILEVIIELAKPLTQDEAKANYKNFAHGDYQARPAAWDLALPILKKAIEEVDGANSRSVESARAAAEALGTADVDGALEVLTAAVNSSQIKQLRGQAILSLGRMGNPGAVPVLANIIREPFDPSKPEMPGAAIIALGQIKSPQAVPVLIEAMYRLPFFFKQVRRALVASGTDEVATRIAKILNGEDGDVNQLFKSEGLDTYKGDVGKDPLPQSEWQKVSAMDYYAAIIAGDLYDPKLIPPLLKSLARDPIPAYFVDSAPGPVSQNAVLDSLRKIGSLSSPDATRAVLDLWTTGKNDDLKPMAANVFSFVSRDGSEKVGKGSALDELGKIAADNDADQSLRIEASGSYGRLASSKDRVPLLIDLAKKYKDASAKAQVEADGPPKAAYEKVKAGYDDIKAKYDAAKKAVKDAGGERKAPIDLIKAETASKLEFDKAKDPYTKAKAAWKALDEKAKAYRGYQRQFETYVARIEITVHCKDDPACYAETVDPKVKWQERWDKVGPRLKSMSSAIEVDKYTDDEKQDALTAQVERAMLELGKLGSKASSQTSVLLDAVKTDDRITRQAILLALPKIAGKDCKDCAAKLDAAIAAGQGKTTLADLNFETQVLRSYFAHDASDGGAAGSGSSGGK